jgi:hypothetical protein
MSAFGSRRFQAMSPKAGALTVASLTTEGGVHDKNVTEQSGTGSEDLTATATNLVWYSNAAQASAIMLPQASAANAGMVITIIVGTTNWSATSFKLGYVDAGNTVMCGQVILNAADGAAQETAGFVVTANAKALVIDSDAVANAGGAIGSKYVFTYLEESLVHVMAFGMITAGAPAPTAAASVTTGIGG